MNSKNKVYIIIIVLLAIASVAVSIISFPHLPKAEEGKKYLTEDRIIEIMGRGSGLCWDDYIKKYPEFGIEKNAFLNRKYKFLFSKDELKNDKVSVEIVSFDKVHYSKNGDYYDLTVIFTIETTINKVRTTATVKGQITTKRSSGSDAMIGNFIKSPDVSFAFK